jgi:hypothetical protein
MADTPPTSANSNPPCHGKPGEVIDPTKIDVYRGGTDLTVKPGETKVVIGLVQPTHGISLETDPALLGRFGRVRKVVSIAMVCK